MIEIIHFKLIKGIILFQRNGINRGITQEQIFGINSKEREKRSLLFGQRVKRKRAFHDMYMRAFF